MAGSSNTDVDLDGSALLFRDEECTADPDDDFLVIQRASNAVSIIYNDLFRIPGLNSLIICQETTTSKSFVMFVIWLLLFSSVQFNLFDIIES